MIFMFGKKMNMNIYFSPSSTVGWLAVISRFSLATSHRKSSLKSIQKNLINSLIKLQSFGIFESPLMWGEDQIFFQGQKKNHCVVSSIINLLPLKKKCQQIRKIWHTSNHIFGCTQTDVNKLLPSRLIK